MNSDAQADYVAKAGRWVLITTGICTLPALVLLGFGIIEYQKPPNYAQNPDPELSVTIPLFLVIASAVVSFAAATMVAVVYYFFARKKYGAVLASLFVSLVALVIFTYFAFPSVQNPVLETRAKAGSLQAQYDLGERYLHGIHIKEDTAKGVYWLTRAAEGGHLAAQLSLGDHYLTSGDREKARFWIERLANSKVDGWERLNAQSRLHLVRDEEPSK